MKTTGHHTTHSLAGAKAAVFNGRVVMIISADGLSSLANLRNNGAVSNVLSAKQQWKEVLSYALNPDLRFIIFNKKLVLKNAFRDRVDRMPPVSFQGKLLAFLLQRFAHFNGEADKGLTIISSNNDPKVLESIVLELAHLNSMDPLFMDWVENANRFTDQWS